MKIKLQNVRCSYVFINEPRKLDNGETGKYSIQVLLDKNDPQVSVVKDAIKSELVSAFGKDAASFPARYKLPLRDADEEGKEEEYYKNMYFFNANAKQKPGIVNKYCQPATQDEIEEYCYSGATFIVSVTFFPFQAKSGSKPGIGVAINNVMLREKTKRIDGTVSAVDEFSEFTEKTTDDFDDL